MALDLVRRCPGCATEHPAQALRCTCGVLLAGVDLTPSRPIVADPGPTAVSEAAPTANLCLHADCAQPNAAGRARCIYCDRPLVLPATKQYTIVWPWGGRTPVAGELLIGRVPPTPSDVIGEINERYDNVSRRHALLRADARGLSIEDLGSSNGTFVNEVRLKAHAPVRLEGGAALRFAADLDALVDDRAESPSADRAD